MFFEILTISIWSTKQWYLTKKKIIKSQTFLMAIRYWQFYPVLDCMLLEWKWWFDCFIIQIHSIHRERGQYGRPEMHIFTVLNMHWKPEKKNLSSLLFSLFSKLKLLHRHHESKLKFSYLNETFICQSQTRYDSYKSTLIT